MLQDFLYEAIYQRDEDDLLPRGVTEQPELKVFIEDFGRQDDHCLVAVVNEQVVGAVWVRILAGNIKGFGYIDEQTPEFAIALYKGYRGQGIGSRLMEAMLCHLRAKGYRRASLAVQKDNYAVGMYRKVGFAVVEETAEEYIMVCEL